MSTSDAPTAVSPIGEGNELDTVEANHTPHQSVATAQSIMAAVDEATANVDSQGIVLNTANQANQAIRNSEITAENMTIVEILERKPFFKGLSTEGQEFLANESQTLSLSQGSPLDKEGLYISVSSTGSDLTVMGEEGPSNIKWHLQQMGNFGEFMFAFGLQPSVQAVVSNETSDFIFMPAESFNKLNPEDQALLKKTAILSARVLAPTNIAVVQDQASAATSGAEINVPSYKGIKVPNWFLSHEELIKETYQPGEEIELEKGKQYIVLRGEVKVKDLSGKQTLAHIKGRTRIGEITTLSSGDKVNPTARLFAGTTDTIIGEIPMASPGSELHLLQLDDMGVAIHAKLAGAAKHQAELRNKRSEKDEFSDFDWSKLLK